MKMIPRRLLTLILSSAACSLFAHTVNLTGFTQRRGEEFPGTKMSYKAIPTEGKIKLDFTKGGRYGALERRVDNKWEKLERVEIDIQTTAKLLQFRVQDSAGRIYQRNLPLSGDGSQPQTLVIDRFYGPKSEGFAQWGKGIENSFVNPPKWYSLIFTIDNGKIVEATIRGIREFGQEKNGIAELMRPSEFRVVPGGVLRLPFSGNPSDSALKNVELSDYDGKKIALSKPAGIDRVHNRVEIPMPGERGFYEVHLPDLDFRCGVIVAPEFSGKPDPYFGMDLALSGSHNYADPETEDSALKLLKRCGIGTIRDRLTWGAIEPVRNQFDFHCTPPLPVDVDRSCDMIRQNGLRVLNVFHTAPAWSGIDLESREKASYPYPRDLVATAESWKKIASRWGDLWDALEVWNEPEIDFGNSLPGDRVAAVQHAVSYALAEAGLPIRISGGVFTGYARGDNFFGPYIENGVFDDADIFSLHDYLEPERFESLISAHRQMLKQTTQPGIPIWITECGMAWQSKGSRALSTEDRASAIAIAGKSFEGKACGIERMFMFIYGFYQQGKNKVNFGFCDRNFTPQRTMAVYAWSAELLANRKYCGDVKVEGAELSRAFTDGEKGVLALLSRSGCVKLPRNFKPDAIFDIDGRSLPLPNKVTLAVPNKIIYLTLPDSRLRKFLQTDTQAMKLIETARRHQPRRRPVHPAVFQNRIDINENFHRIGGYLAGGERMTFRFSVHNLSDRQLDIRPELSVPHNALLSVNWKGMQTIAPKSEKMFEAVLSPAKLFSGKDQTAKVVVMDANDNAAPLTVRLLNWNFENLDVVPLEKKQAAWQEIKSWKPWASTLKEPNIRAKFRTFWNQEFLRLEVEVTDPKFHQPYPADEAWQGDSIQIGLQHYDEGKPMHKGATEVTVASADGKPVIYRHLSQNGRGENSLLQKSRLDFQNKDGRQFYRIDLNWSEIGFSKPVAGKKFGLSLLVNSNEGKGRCGILYWGEGIAVSKQPTEYNQLKLVK